MHRVEPPPPPAEEPDLLDRVPMLGRAATRLEASVGPSCLLSLIIVFLLFLVLRQALSFSPVGLAVLALVIWFGVLTLLVRARGRRIEDDG